MEWYEKYRGASDVDAIIQALNACAAKDCNHCLYQGNGISCSNKLKLDAARMIVKMKEEVSK